MGFSVKIFSFISLLLVLSVVVFDSKFHFDSERVQLKRQNKSAQRNWSLFYSQKYIYHDSSMRYSSDLIDIADLITPHSVVISDISTSYYLAAELPVFIVNVHRHQGFRQTKWSKILSQLSFCYLENNEHLEMVREFLLRQRSSNDEMSTREQYLVINQDSLNLNMRYDCLSARDQSIINNMDKIGKLLYRGEYLVLYKI